MPLFDSKRNKRTLTQNHRSNLSKYKESIKQLQERSEPWSTEGTRATGPTNPTKQGSQGLRDWSSNHRVCMGLYKVLCAYTEVVYHGVFLWFLTVEGCMCVQVSLTFFSAQGTIFLLLHYLIQPRGFVPSFLEVYAMFSWYPGESYSLLKANGETTDLR